jgi:hypothetical protein
MVNFALIALKNLVVNILAVWFVRGREVFVAATRRPDDPYSAFA